MTQTQALWQPDSAPTPRAALAASTDVDVAIVGAGFTGLWTAYYLKKQQPSCRIAVIEARTAGFGASGRNGGWCSALLPMGIARLRTRHGSEAATSLQRHMFDTVDEVGRVIDHHGIDADYAKGGTIQLARNAIQLDRLQAEFDELAAYGFGEADHQMLSGADASAMCNASDVVGGLFTPHCAALHPGRLVRGLAEVVEAMGVTIYENSPALAVQPRCVRVTGGDVRAEVVVRATEGYSAAIPGHERVVVPVYSLMIATEPLPAAILNAIGLRDRPTFSDARHLVIYGQRTADGRLAFGGRGAPYHWGSAVRPEFEQHRPTHDALRRILVDLFPVLYDVAITHEWGGALGIARDWYCSVGLDRATGAAWAGGYVGDGVATTNLAGRTLADLICGQSTDLTALPWVNHRSPQWEREPWRWLGINAAARLPVRIDRVESRGHRARASAALLGRLTGH